MTSLAITLGILIATLLIIFLILWLLGHVERPLVYLRWWQLRQGDRKSRNTPDDFEGM